MNDVRKILAFLLGFALVVLLVYVGPILLALAFARRGEGRHPFVWLFGTIALALYGLKHLASPRRPYPELPHSSRIV